MLVQAFSPADNNPKRNRGVTAERAWVALRFGAMPGFPHALRFAQTVAIAQHALSFGPAKAWVRRGGNAGV